MAASAYADTALPAYQMWRAHAGLGTIHNEKRTAEAMPNNVPSMTPRRKADCVGLMASDIPPP